MKKCPNCRNEMKEDCSIKIENGTHGIEVYDESGLFSCSLGRPAVAVCPCCGEVSLYIDVSRMKK